MKEQLAFFRCHLFSFLRTPPALRLLKYCALSNNSYLSSPVLDVLFQPLVLSLVLAQGEQAGSLSVLVSLSSRVRNPFETNKFRYSKEF